MATKIYSYVSEAEALDTTLACSGRCNIFVTSSAGVAVFGAGTLSIFVRESSDMPFALLGTMDSSSEQNVMSFDRILYGDYDINCEVTGADATTDIDVWIG